MTWLNVIASNVGSFVLGVLVCRWLARRAASAADSIHDHSEVNMADRRPPLMPLPARVVVLVLIGTLMFGLGVRVGYEVLASKVGCFNEYASKNADSQAARSTATEALQDADARQDRAILAALTPGHDKVDVAELRAATQAKVEKKQELAEQRKQNPYPDPPREVC